MEAAALEALETWKPDYTTSHISRYQGTDIKLELGTAGPDSFAVRASFQFPDGGRFALVLNGSKSEDSVHPFVEGGIGLPDGVVIDVNSYIFTSIFEHSPRYTPKEMVKATLEYMNKRYKKAASPTPATPSNPIASSSKGEKRPQSDLSVSNRLGLIRKKRGSVEKYAPQLGGKTRHATATLMKQINLLSKMDTRKDGFIAKPIDDNLYKWNVQLYFDDTSSRIASDLRKTPSHDHVKMEFNFPAEYPNVPPVVRVISPYISGGHVASCGGICMELLTASGWAPVNSIDVVCIQIRAMLIQGNARLVPEFQYRVRDYTMEGALQDLNKIVSIHGWHTRRPRRKGIPKS